MATTFRTRPRMDCSQIGLGSSVRSFSLKFLVHLLWRFVAVDGGDPVKIPERPEPSRLIQIGSGGPSTRRILRAYAPVFIAA
jgi:hypothetical protein